ELRKLHFAIGLTRRPWLVIMDEPTNHLDLQATELLENALAQIESALILVSHDLQFIERLTTRRLHFPA
ncbi:MAG TPA: ABC transporter ATP-binding protein, partial [Candidatus Riflebacteria bacterium]|nr:ABC transporter ATP-binding protein [Candidatus Riflebacteria bacterium]